MTQSSWTFTQESRNPQNLKQILNQFLDDEINHQKLSHLKNWIGDHATDSVEFSSKISDVEETKTSLNQLLQDLNNRQKLFRIAVTLETEEQWI